MLCMLPLPPFVFSSISMLNKKHLAMQITLFKIILLALTCCNYWDSIQFFWLFNQWIPLSFDLLFVLCSNSIFPFLIMHIYVHLWDVLFIDCASNFTFLPCLSQHFFPGKHTLTLLVLAHWSFLSSHDAVVFSAGADWEVKGLAFLYPNKLSTAKLVLQSVQWRAWDDSDLSTSSKMRSLLGKFHCSTIIFLKTFLIFFYVGFNVSSLSPSPL